MSKSKTRNSFILFRSKLCTFFFSSENVRWAIPNVMSRSGHLYAKFHVLYKNRIIFLSLI